MGELIRKTDKKSPRDGIVGRLGFYVHCHCLLVQRQTGHSGPFERVFKLTCRVKSPDKVRGQLIQ